VKLAKHVYGPQVVDEHPDNPDFQYIYIVYDLWEKEKCPSKSRKFPTTQNEVRNF
jgi:hypothetical protein